MLTCGYSTDSDNIFFGAEDDTLFIYSVSGDDYDQSINVSGQGGTVFEATMSTNQIYIAAALNTYTAVYSYKEADAAFTFDDDFASTTESVAFSSSGGEMIVVNEFQI